MPDLTRFAEMFADNQILLLLAALILAFLGYALLKKLLKLALFVAVFLAIYSGLVYYFG